MVGRGSADAGPGAGAAAGEAWAAGGLAFSAASLSRSMRAREADGEALLAEEPREGEAAGGGFGEDGTDDLGELGTEEAAAGTATPACCSAASSVRTRS